MKSKKVKHNKLKNTGLLFEFLVRQITADVLNKTSKSPALSITKNYFNAKTEVSKERTLYNMIVNQKYKTDKQAQFFINEVNTSFKQLNRSKLRKEKYQLVKDIQKNYNLQEFLSSSIPNYKSYASAYKLFEYGDKLNPEEKTETHFNLVENITSAPEVNLNDSVGKKLQSSDELRVLTYKILLERFNAKYQYLNGKQKHLLKEYINNVSNTNSLKEFINSCVSNLKKSLNEHISKVDHKITKIKLREAVNSIDKFCGPNEGKLVADSSVLQVMRYYELEKELIRRDRGAKRKS